MKKNNSKIYKSPYTQSSLELIINREENENIIDGMFVDEEKNEFPIKDGIVDFTWPKDLASVDQETRKIYNSLAETYELFSSIPFRTYKCNESEIREKITEKLDLSLDSKVLEIGCGCGDGSIHIADRLSKDGELFLQELSPLFLNKAINKTLNKIVPIEYSIANGCYLPFSNNYFDAAHHFGGINTFSDIQRCLQELGRVVKPGGKVVVGDEGLGEWLRDTTFGKIMQNSNPLLKCRPPLHLLPSIAKNVNIEWIMMGAFYVIEFTVSDTEPEANYHIPIPSERGGTHWTRYYGNLEGVSDETKKLAKEVIKKRNISMHDWLDSVVLKAAKKELGEL